MASCESGWELTLSISAFRWDIDAWTEASKQNNCGTLMSPSCSNTIIIENRRRSHFYCLLSDTAPINFVETSVSSSWFECSHKFTREFFTHLETPPLSVKRFKFWTMLGTYGYWTARDIYCDTGHPFIMVISEDPWYSQLLPRVSQWSCHYLF